MSEPHPQTSLESPLPPLPWPPPRRRRRRTVEGMTLIEILIVVTIMSVGVLFGRKPIQGSCGGLSALSKEVGQPLCEVKRRGATGVMLVEIGKLGCKFGIFLGGLVGFLQLQNERHQGFGDIAATENAEMTCLVRASTEGIRLGLLVHGTILLLYPAAAAL